MCNFDFYIVLRNLGRDYSFGNFFLQCRCTAPRSSPVPGSSSFLGSRVPACWSVGVAGHCSVPLCFPGEGAPQVEEGLPWEEKLWKISNCFQKKNCPTSWSSPEGHLEKWATGKNALSLAAALSLCSLDLSRGEAGGIPAPFYCCTEKEDGVLITACQAGSAGSTRLTWNF